MNRAQFPASCSEHLQTFVLELVFKFASKGDPRGTLPGLQADRTMLNQPQWSKVMLDDVRANPVYRFLDFSSLECHSGDP